MTTEAIADRITVVGLGPMGYALAETYLRQGRDITVWNRTPGKAAPLVELGARRADTVTEAVEASEVIVVCLSDYTAMYDVLRPADGALSGRTVVNLSSGTPGEAAAAVEWARERGADYLDGAIMVPPAAVGHPDSVFLYSGPKALFDAHEDALRVMGGATYLGADPGLAVLHNTALLGLMYALVNGFLHSAALVRTGGVTAVEFSGLALDWFLPKVLTPILRGEVARLDARDYPGDDGTLQMNRNALEHILRTSQEHGVDAALPTANLELADRAIAAGFGQNGYAAVFEVVTGAPEGTPATDLTTRA